MRKRLVETLIIACFALGLATLAYAGSSTLSFSGGSGSILIITTAPGITIDNFEVSGGGSFSANQYLSTSSAAIIIRDGEFSGGGFIRVATNTADPEVELVAYLDSDNSGYLQQSVDTRSSVEFELFAQGEGSGNLAIFTHTGERLDFQFILMYDASTIDTIINAKPFHLGWVTQYDSGAQIDGGMRTE